jgi:hypothetical protein
MANPARLEVQLAPAWFRMKALAVSGGLRVLKKHQLLCKIVTDTICTLLPINFITDTQYVIPIGIAGIQKPRMASANHILVAWIPAVHAGMTCYLYGHE